MSNLKHVAIIMDGNGRWANSRFRPRVWGHVRGSSVVSNIVEEADHLGLKALTLYAFSTENFSRPLEEVTTLFKLLKKFLQREKIKIIKNKIKFKVIGDISSLPIETQELIQNIENETRRFEGLNLNFAFGYGARTEIINSVNAFMKENPAKKITEEYLEQFLYNPEAGDVDLLIRTGGDYRISNFLLWQSAYAEFYFTQTPWPDFTVSEFKNIISDVSNRERRFGTVGSANLSQAKINASKNIGKLKLGVES